MNMRTVTAFLIGAGIVQILVGAAAGNILHLGISTALVVSCLFVRSVYSE
jgi:hypothetical protein